MRPIRQHKSTSGPICPSDRRWQGGYPGSVTAIRSLFAQRHLAVLLCAATLLLKLIVPTGYMIGQVDGHAAILLCPGSGPVLQTVMASHDGMTMMSHHARGDRPTGHPGGSHQHETPCAFAGLAAPGLAVIDPIQLAQLIAFILAVGLVAVRLPRARPILYLRPPLRGPPALF